MQGRYPLLPILIGVTGHRDIAVDALPAVRKSVRASLSALKNCFLSNLVLVTALAEGADQLVAEIASELEIGMITISPMSIDEYRLTMESNDAVSNFDRLWWSSRVLERIELPKLPGYSEQEQAPAQYEQLGLLLARQSHILLAIWNGVDSEPHVDRHGRWRKNRGGSAHVIALRQNGDHAEIAPAAIARSSLFLSPPPRLDQAQGGPILQVMCLRRSKPRSGCQTEDGRLLESGALRWWSDLPPGRTTNWYDRLREVVSPRKSTRLEAPDWSPITAQALSKAIPSEIRRIRDANYELTRRAAIVDGRNTGSFLCSSDDFVGQRNLKALRRLGTLFDSADEDATVFQRLLFGAWLPGLPFRVRPGPPLGVLFAFALAVPAATLCLEIYTAYGYHEIWLGLYIACLVLPLLAFSAIRAVQWQARYQDHRALAEAVRVQFFWAASGIPIAVSDNYLRDQSGLLGWIRFALRGAAIDGLAAALAIRTADAAFVQAKWIRDQLKYFDRQRELQEKAAISVRRWATGIVVTLFLTAAFALFIRIHEAEWRSFAHGWVTEAPLVLLGTLPALAAFFVIISEGRAYEEHAHAYTRARDLYAEADRQAGSLIKGEDTSEWRDLLIPLGQQALAENAAWIHTHRARPVANKVG